MSLYITCPRCHVSLKANKLPTATKAVICPECRRSFQVANTGVTAALPHPKFPAFPADSAPTPAISTPPSARWLPFAVIASILLVGAGIITAIVLTRSPIPQDAVPAPIVIVKGDKDESTSSESAKETDKDQDKHRQHFIRLMIEGGTSLIGQRYDEAVSAYTEASKLFPDDPDVRQKLSEAQTAFAKQRDAKLEQEKLRKDANQLVKKGQAALEEKQYSAAVEFFRLALQKNAGLSDASQGLIAAQAALDHDQLDQKKLAEYEQLIISGKAAMKANRFADAIRDFLSAQRVVPNDPIAMQFQREAEKQLDGLMNRADKMKEFQRLLDLANTSLRNKAFEDAERGFQRALRLFPNDAAALQGIEEAQKLHKQAKTEFAGWMLKGNTALQLGRFGEASLAFREATRLFANDQDASRALRQTELLQDNQNRYTQAMQRGVAAMGLKQFADAIVAYNDALRAVPNDAAALLGLQDAQRAFDGDQVRRMDFDRRASAGLQLLKAQKYAEAAVELRAALRHMPYNPQADIVERQARYADAMAKGTAALDGRRFSEASSQFQAALDQFPNDFAARGGLNKARAGNKRSS